MHCIYTTSKNRLDKFSLWIFSEITNGCQAPPKYSSFCDSSSALAFLQKRMKPHKNFGCTET